MRIIDLSAALLRDDRLDPRAPLGLFAAIVVESATHPGATFSPAPVCRHRLTSRECDGTLALGDDGREISWRCTRCEDAGVVVGWTDTVFDLRDAPRSHEAGPLRVYLRPAELYALRRHARPRELRAHLAALPSAAADIARFTSSAEPLAALATLVERAARVETVLQERRALDRVGAKLELTLDAHRFASPAP